MHRLQFELERLYLSRPAAGADGGTVAPAMVDAQGRVRALVLELMRPPSWDLLARVWQGVQVQMALPAPAIAVSGTDGLQLWFSLAEPVDVARATAFLEGLRQRYLADIDPARVRLLPTAEASTPLAVRHAPRVPAEQAGTGNWSAFVAQDLAPVFADAPWLDIPPGEEGQANLLRGISPIPSDAFAASLALLQPDPPAGSQADAPVAPRAQAAPPATTDPKQFLERVMNDDSVAMALRIEAARALLAHAPGPRT